MTTTVTTMAGCRPFSLRIKIAALAAEQAIIRRHEKRERERARWCRTVIKYQVPDDVTGKPRDWEAWLRYVCRHDEARVSMHVHRTVIVRTELRASLLAYAFLRGRRYDDAEATRPLLTPRHMTVIETLRLTQRVASIAARHIGFGVTSEQIMPKLQAWLHDPESLELAERRRQRADRREDNRRQKVQAAWLAEKKRTPIEKMRGHDLIDMAYGPGYVPPAEAPPPTIPAGSPDDGSLVAQNGDLVVDRERNILRPDVLAQLCRERRLNYVEVTRRIKAGETLARALSQEPPK